jgi:hypothetical protein
MDEVETRRRLIDERLRLAGLARLFRSTAPSDE